MKRHAHPMHHTTGSRVRLAGERLTLAEAALAVACGLVFAAAFFLLPWVLAAYAMAWGLL
jgi:hypothetical protein